MTFHVNVFENDTRIFSCEVSGVLELGRQQADEPSAIALLPLNGKHRLIVADLHYTSLARHQLRVEPLNDGTLRFTNLSAGVPLALPGGDELEALATRIFTMPATIHLSRSLSVAFHIVSAKTKLGPVLNSLVMKTQAPGMRQQFSQSVAAPSVLQSSVDSEELERIVLGLCEAMEIFQNARSTESLYEAAVTGAVKVIGFHGARLLRYDRGAWEEVRQYGKLGSSASRFILGEILKVTKTLWHSGSGTETESLLGLEAVIAVPILNRAGAVIGSLYAERQYKGGGNSWREISRTEAHLLELYAYGVASEMARRSQEDESRRLRIQFEQFFSPELARELEVQPNLLEGRDVNVSILFCDIKGFSRISERLDTQMIFRFINEVIGACSECVVKNGGVLVDYVGDALMAMWGAPQTQPNHAELACQAALDMLGRLPELNRQWETLTGEEVYISIGINTGHARAGNAGSEHKFKYGPLGKTVNLASRVQGATKYFKTRILITAATAKAVNGEFHRRRICDVRVVNINEPVGLFELNLNESHSLMNGYEEALTQFENGEFRVAARQLSQLLESFPNDGPTLVLLSRCVNAIVEGPEPQHPVLILNSK